ncbi:MAG: hypothetical protein KDB14_29210 [Planctomycetales bacterium]|nr:hypothetical protein [Planctomycetales bacterium]
MSVEVAFQPNDSDYIDGSREVVIEWMNDALAGESPCYAHIWYGSVSSESPLLSFACFPGVGVYLSFNLRGRARVLVDSSDYSELHPIEWGQDSVLIPRAHITGQPTAERILNRFCGSGTVGNDCRWERAELS